MSSQQRWNTRLKALMAEADWSGDQLARSVNAVGEEVGVRLHYGRSSVSQWLRGARPRRPVPQIICESLTRRLGRTLTTADIGMAGPEASAPGQRDLTVRLIELGDAARTGADAPRLGANIYSASIAAEAATEAAAIDFTYGDRGDRCEERGADGIVSAAESLLAIFGTATRVVGSGPMREALSGQLATMVGTWLRTAGPAESDLYRVVSKLTYLCGFLCFDDELQGLAQRYYALALQFSAGADDPVGYGRALRAMSVQARFLGRPQVALPLAEASVDVAVRGARSGPDRAYFLGELAVCHAAVGDSQDALKWLDETEREYECAGEGNEEEALGPAGVYHRGSLARTRSIVHTLLGDRPRAIIALRKALRYQPADDRRSRAIWLARLAELHLQSGHLDQAVGAWHQFLDIYPTISSGRASTAFENLLALTRPHKAYPQVSSLRDRACALGQPVRVPG